LQLWVEMQRKGLEPDVITYSALINACARAPCREDFAALGGDAAEGA
jgi:hypothetical protein